VVVSTRCLLVDQRDLALVCQPGLDSVYFYQGQEGFEEVTEEYGNRGLCLVAFGTGLERDWVSPVTGFVLVVTGFWMLEKVVVAVASLVTGTYR
jgi:hypothetical protein